MKKSSIFSFHLYFCVCFFPSTTITFHFTPYMKIVMMKKSHLHPRKWLSFSSYTALRRKSRERHCVRPSSHIATIHYIVYVSTFALSNIFFSTMWRNILEKSTVAVSTLKISIENIFSPIRTHKTYCKESLSEILNMTMIKQFFLMQNDDDKVKSY